MDYPSWSVALDGKADAVPLVGFTIKRKWSYFCNRPGSVDAYSKTSGRSPGAYRLIHHITMCANSSTYTQYGAVFYSKGDVLITDGVFSKNLANDRGGVFDAGSEGVFTIVGGRFEGNTGGNDGGVGFVTAGSRLSVEGGSFRNNLADRGGVLSVEENTKLEVRRDRSISFHKKMGPGWGCERVCIL